MGQHRLGEPLGGIVRALRGEQSIRVGVPQPHRARARLRAIDATAGEHCQRNVQLTEIASRTGHDDEQLHVGLGIELSRIGVVEHSNRLLWTAERPLAVRHQRQVAGIARDPASGAEFAQRLRPFFGVIRGHADRLSHRGHPGRPIACCSGVLECPDGVDIE